MRDLSGGTLEVEGRRSAWDARRGAALFCLGIVVLFALSVTPVALRAERLTVATYNLENYLSADRMVEGVYRQDYPKPEAEKAALRAVIRATHADVIAFQEMGPLPYLRELQHDLAADGCEYRYAELLEGKDADRHVAVLSHRPFSSVTKHTDLSFAYFKSPEVVKRGLLEVRVKVGATEVTIFAVHLKSRFTDRSDDPMSALRRAGEATAVRDRVLNVVKDPEAVRFFIIGDCNDVPKSRPLAALSHRGKTKIADPLAAMDSRGETWTHFYRKEESYSRIDYILVSPALRDDVVGDKARIIDVPETLVASDHRPVVVTIDVK